MNDIKLTRYSHGAGCGCKISPAILSTILKSNVDTFTDKNLIVGNDKRDDAAVYDIGNGKAIISTTDFFMPIVDDPYIFGRIAATNAISDIYAMGGKPLLSIAILGWPLDKLSPEIAQLVMDGGRHACKDAGIMIAGGHSIDSPEPIFGLAVTGSVEIKKLKRNDTATVGCQLLLTKPLGVGILTTAEKKGLLKEEHANVAADTMLILNSVGYELADIKGVTAMTDVTGFALLGHLAEMCEGSGLSAIIEYDKIPKFDMLDYYIQNKCIPGGTGRNWNSYGCSINLKDTSHKTVLCDPQTSGGLLIAVEAEALEKVETILKDNNIFTKSFGRLTEKTESTITVI